MKLIKVWKKYIKNYLEIILIKLYFEIRLF